MNLYLADRAGERLDVFLVRHMPECSRSYVQRLITDGNVRVDGARVKPNYKLRSGEEICCTVPPAEEVVIAAEDIPLDVLQVAGCLRTSPSSIYKLIESEFPAPP